MVSRKKKAVREDGPLHRLSVAPFVGCTQSGSDTEFVGQVDSLIRAEPPPEDYEQVDEARPVLFAASEAGLESFANDFELRGATEHDRIWKYWVQRKSLLSLFESGCVLDEESFFSITPENIAWHLAERLACDFMVDAFCGAGGNTIQFAATCSKVLAIDNDPLKIELAKHNCSVYGVEEGISFVCADFLALSPFLQADCIYFSPPWGGPEYSQKTNLTLADCFASVGGIETLREALKRVPTAVVCCPRNLLTDPESLQQALGKDARSIEVENNLIGDKSKLLHLYIISKHFPRKPSTA